MKNYQYYLFDLDGTLTDSAEGITKSVQYALDKMGIEIGLEEARIFIGPPLRDSFSQFYHMNEEDCALGVKYYRERFSVVGWKENKVYDGITDVLKALKDQGKILCVATSKPIEFTIKILDLFDLSKYFDIVVGATMDGSMDSKAKVVSEVIRQISEKYGEYDKSKMLMVGDRKFDILGAKECGLECLGVYYGFAPEGELEEYGAKYVVQTTKELLDLVSLHE